MINISAPILLGLLDHDIDKCVKTMIIYEAIINITILQLDKDLVIELPVMDKVCVMGPF